MPDSPVAIEAAGVKRDAIPDDEKTVKRQKPGSDDGMMIDSLVNWGSVATERSLQLSHGGVFDVTIGWDFALRKHRDAAMGIIERVHPQLIVGSTASRSD